jgi:hypothetical protein
MSENPSGKTHEPAESTRGAVADVLDNLGALFRHMLPGAIILGAARIAHPSWFAGFDSAKWEHLALAGTT